MNRLRTRFAVFLLAGLLLTGAIAGSNSENSNTELVAAIHLYRTEGAEAALPGFERLLAEFEASGDGLNEATALRYIGESHWRLGSLDDSRAFLDRALSLTRELGERYAEGKTLNTLGLLAWDLGDYDTALDAMGKANAIARELGDPKLTASTLNNMGLVHDELGDYQVSLEKYQRAYELFAGIDNLRGQGDALGNLGGVHLLLGHYREALNYYQRALAISKQLQSKPAMTIDHGNLALCYLGLGAVGTALEHFDTALQLAAETGMRQEQAYWQLGKADALVRQGKFDLGLENYRAALSTYEETGARGLLLDALHDMGAVHLALGDPVSAEQYFQRAITLAREIGHQQAITVNLIALGDLQFKHEQLEQANALFLQANHRATEAGEVNYRAQSLLKLALVNRDLNRYRAAMEYAADALVIARETGALSMEAEAWYSIGELHSRQDNLEEAFRAFASAQAAAGADGDPGLLWQIHYGRAQAQVRAGDKNAAVAELKAAVTIIEGVRDRLHEERFQAGYVQDKYQVYIDLVRLQLELGQTEDAFTTAERLRARSFLAQLDKGAPLVRSETDRRTEMAMRERIRQLQNTLTEEQRKGRPERRQLALEAFSSELMMAEREYQAFLDDTSGRGFASASMELPDLAAVQNQLLTGEALVEYVIDEDYVMAFVVRRQHLAASSFGLGQDALNTKVNLVREMIRQTGNQRWIKPAASLSAALVDPLLEQGLLDGVSHLFLVPHGILNYLPFALLPLGDSSQQLLMERYTLSYLPAASALVQPQNNRNNGNGNSGRSLLVLAPQKARLKYAPEEARSIAALFQPHARLLEGKDATESAFKRHAKEYSVLHLATHGYFNKHNPLLSGLELEADSLNDGLLEVHEILGLELHAQLVTLSACQTGLGSGWFDQIPAGDDFVGLTRAFLFAGSNAVLASLWEVDDRSTVDLMEGFYQRLGTRDGQSDRAAALAHVQRRMRTSKQFNHPFYWAPFVLVGQRGRIAAQI